MVLAATAANALDNILVGRGFHGHGVLHQPVEELASTARCAAVEPERELVAVTIQVSWTDRALVGAKNPPLQERRNTMTAGQQVTRRHLGPLEDSNLVSISFPSKPYFFS